MKYTFIILLMSLLVNMSHANKSIAWLNGKSLMISIDRIDLNGLDDKDLTRYHPYLLIQSGVGDPDLNLITFVGNSSTLLSYDEERVAVGDVIQYDLKDFALDSLRKISGIKSVEDISVKLDLSEVDIIWAPIPVPRNNVILETGNEITLGDLFENEKLTMRSENKVLGISYEFTLWIED